MHCDMIASQVTTVFVGLHFLSLAVCHAFGPPPYATNVVQVKNIPTTLEEDLKDNRPSISKDYIFIPEDYLAFHISSPSSNEKFIIANKNSYDRISLPSLEESEPEQITFSSKEESIYEKIFIPINSESYERFSMPSYEDDSRKVFTKRTTMRPILFATEAGQTDPSNSIEGELTDEETSNQYRETSAEQTETDRAMIIEDQAINEGKKTTTAFDKQTHSIFEETFHERKNKSKLYNGKIKIDNNQIVRSAEGNKQTIKKGNIPVQISRQNKTEASEYFTRKLNNAATQISRPVVNENSDSDLIFKEIFHHRQYKKLRGRKNEKHNNNIIAGDLSSLGGVQHTRMFPKKQNFKEFKHQSHQIVDKIGLDTNIDDLYRSDVSAQTINHNVKDQKKSKALNMRKTTKRPVESILNRGNKAYVWEKLKFTKLGYGDQAFSIAQPRPKFEFALR